MISITNQIKAKRTKDGAGVPLNRVFGYNNVPIFDPFLLLDYFYTEDTEEVMMGFPWHPHRGIETITYMKSGFITHEDNIGNKGIIGPADVQWMTAGRGIIHQEMPQNTSKGLEGFQFWLNLSQKDKMIEPAYGELKSADMAIVENGGAFIKIIAGKIGDATGPIDREGNEVSLMDIRLKKEEKFIYDKKEHLNLFIFIYHGSIKVADQIINPLTAITLEGEGKVELEALEDSVFILALGKPHDEPVAWRGPIVMNTMEEINKAFEEISDGSFIKK